MDNRFNKLYYLIFLLFSVTIIAGPLLKFYNLRTNIADLGFFMSNFSSANIEWWRSFSGHVQPLMFFYGQIYSLVPQEFSPYLLLISQSFVIIFSSYLVNKYYGLIPCIAFMLYYPVWNNALFDFHFDHLAILFILLFFINFKKLNLFKCFIFAISLMFIKETFALQTVACGFFIVLSEIFDRKSFGLNYIIGILIILTGSLYFIFCMEFILPYFSQNSSKLGIGSFAFNWLGDTYVSIIINIVFNIPDIFYRIFSNIDKIKFLLILFAPLLFIPFLFPRPLIIAVPPLMISLLSNLSNHYDYSNHYTSGLIAPILVSFAGGYNLVIKLFNKKYTDYFIFFTLLLSIFMLGSTPISRLFWSTKVWSYSYQAYLPNNRDKAISSLINKYIPIDRSIIISSQNNINNSVISNRLVVLPYPLGVLKPYTTISFNDLDKIDLYDLYFKKLISFPYIYRFKYADYVIIDTARPHFFIDKGCNWIYGVCIDNSIDIKYNDSIDNLKLSFKELVSYDGFYIYKKND